MTNCEMILKVLKDGQWHHVLNIIQAVKPGAVNFACRSRISDLKKKGHSIERRIAADGQAEYRLKETAYNIDDKGQYIFICKEKT